MSIFSKIKGAKKAAKDHKVSSQAEITDKPAPTPYKHVPTHAAVDALSGAPSTWKEEDRELIIAHHKRRSAMVRNDSDLSAVTSLNTSINRSSSSPSFYANSHRMSSQPKLETRRSHLGYAGYEGYASARNNFPKSPLGSNQISPTGSSNNSTSSRSSQALEMNRAPEVNIFEHIHKPTYRNVGEAPLLRNPPSQTSVPRTQSVPALPQQKQKRSWGFGRKSVAIAAH
ncbi:hypothetical protein MMC09_003698 [Bachmanniomyces sp. S44760]|nr:hypothetical protein [Bachmanniomyces sp. S44760]